MLTAIGSLLRVSATLAAAIMWECPKATLTAVR